MWTSEDVYRQMAFITVSAIDWRQTQRIANSPEKWRELNPVLGEHPTQKRVNVYFFSAIVAHTVIAALLPKECRKNWQYFWTGAQGAAVSWNYRQGIKP
jgi:hypothetical protein